MNRRSFLGVSVAVASTAAVPAGPPLGVVARPGGLATVKRLGFSNCQLAVGMAAPELATSIRDDSAKYGVTVTALMTLGAGRMVWNLREGPKTIGIIPRDTRAQRVAALKRASDLARACGVKAVHTHCGFIPEDPNDPLYPETVEVIKEVATYLGNNGQTFLMETGQETPITLKRAIDDVGLDNVAVNLDLANLILYGKGEPVGALNVIGHHVRGVHAKDGNYPQDPYGLGEEAAIGRGEVRFREVFEALHRLHYTGPVTIEREIAGPKQESDIAASKIFLEEVIKRTWNRNS